MAGPNREVLIPHICPRTGVGVTVSAETEPTEANIMLAATNVNSCEAINGPCPEDCALKKLAETNDYLKNLRDMFGGV